MALPRLGRLAALVGGVLCGAPGLAGAQAADTGALLAAAERANISGHYRVSEAMYLQVLKLDNVHIDARRGLAFVLAEQGRTEEAAAAYEAVLAIAPRDPLALYNLAALLDATAPRRALPVWAAYITVAEDLPEERLFLARARARVRKLTGP